MATLAEINAAIRAADAAGDGDAVRKLAAARTAMMASQSRAYESDPAGTQQAPSAIEAARMTPDQQRSAGVMDTANSPEDMQRMQQNGQRGAQSMLTGIEEGGRQFLGGMKQLGASAQDAYNVLVHGKRAREEEMITKSDGTRVRLHDLVDDSAEKKTIAEEMQRQQVQQEVDRQKGANIPDRNFSAKATQLAAAVGGPEVALPRATTMTGAMLRNATAGNIGNATIFDADGGSLSDAGIASAAPAVFGIIPALAPAVKNYVGRAFQRLTNAGRTSPRVAEFAGVMPETAKTLTLAQRTGVPELITLERAASNSDMVNHFADQTDKFANEMVGILRQPVREGQTLSNDFVAARARADHNLKQFKIAASNNYEAGIQEARRIASEGGAGNVIPVDTFRDQMRTTFEKVRGLRERGVKSAIFSNRFMNNLEGYFEQKTSLNTRELTDTLVDLTAMQKAKDPLTRKMAGEMRNALDQDLQRIEDTGTFEADDAVKTILETRAEYKRGQQLIGELGDSAGYKLLGVADRDVAPDTVLQKFKGFTPEKRAEVRNFLEENSPDMLTTLKQAAVDEVAAGAKTIRAGADSQTDLNALTDAMFNPKGFDLRTAGLWNADELKRIEGIKQGLRSIANNRPNVGPAGTPIKPEDIAINAVSQHPAFLARALARVMMSVKGAKFFTDPAIYERLRTINRSTSGGPTNMLARAALLDYLQTDYMEQEPKQ